MVYNPHVHARRSIRLQHYDYRSRGAYFVTICTHMKACIFVDERLRRIVEYTWRSVVQTLESDQSFDSVVMPNHIHGIVWIAPAVRVSHSEQGQKVGVAAGSLGAIVGAFKAVAARRVSCERGTPGACLAAQLLRARAADRPRSRTGEGIYCGQSAKVVGGPEPPAEQRCVPASRRWGEPLERLTEAMR